MSERGKQVNEQDSTQLQVHTDTYIISPHLHTQKHIANV